MNIISAQRVLEMAKEAGFTDYYPERLTRFAALVRADLMKQVMDTCEAEYELYDEMVAQDDAGHEEATAILHLMRKLDRLRPATGKAEREWVDLTDDEIALVTGCQKSKPNWIVVKDITEAVIATFKTKQDEMK